MRIMRTNYNEGVTLLEKKNFISSLSNEYEEEMVSIMNEKDFSLWLRNSYRNHEFYELAVDQLYQCHDFSTMEVCLRIMNVLFDNEEFDLLKNELYQKIMKRKISLDEYCVLRYLSSYHQCQDLIRHLYQNDHADGLECAKMCLIEDQYHLAYHYLRTLDQCPDEKVLDLLCSYSLCEYLSLMKYYREKKKNYIYLLTQ